MNKRIEHYFEDDKYGHDFIEELVNLDLIQKYGYDSFRIFVLWARYHPNATPIVSPNIFIGESA